MTFATAHLKGLHKGLPWPIKSLQDRAGQYAAADSNPSPRLCPRVCPALAIHPSRFRVPTLPHRIGQLGFRDGQTLLDTGCARLRLAQWLGEPKRRRRRDQRTNSRARSRPLHQRERRRRAVEHASAQTASSLPHFRNSLGQLTLMQNSEGQVRRGQAGMPALCLHRSRVRWLRHLGRGRKRIWYPGEGGEYPDPSSITAVSPSGRPSWPQPTRVACVPLLPGPDPAQDSWGVRL